ncbi:MAG: bifunctional riboflavin kinase/FMN adenylyltransferase [Candidatus Omnitrophota bacterium]
MRIIYGLNRIPRFKQPVAAIGVFDGVHRGHQKILKAAVSKARATGGTSVVLTFWPHPQKGLSLYSLAHRLRLIAELGIDACVVIKFSPRFARLPAEDFVRNILCGKINARCIYIGKNFRFGKRAEGNYKTLIAFAKLCNFNLRVFDCLKINGKNISSTLIRVLIKKGNLAAAQKLLGRRVVVLGTVIKGASLAARLGFPTANINPHHEVLPPPGIYAVKIIYEKKNYFGACYIGHKPTFNRNIFIPKMNMLRLPRRAQLIRDGIKSIQRVGVKAQQPGIEVHIFNFRKNLYGKDLEIHFLRKIREERKFNSPLELTAQIQKDIISAKSINSFHK